VVKPCDQAQSASVTMSIQEDKNETHRDQAGVGLAAHGGSLDR
jgi:hypothetical protein